MSGSIPADQVRKLIEKWNDDARRHSRNGDSYRIGEGWGLKACADELDALITSATPQYHEGACRDCGLPYETFKIDVVLPDDQWAVVCPEGGVLCAGCLVARCAKLPHALVVRAKVEGFHEDGDVQTAAAPPMSVERTCDCQVYEVCPVCDLDTHTRLSTKATHESATEAPTPAVCPDCGMSRDGNDFCSHVFHSHRVSAPARVDVLFATELIRAFLRMGVCPSGYDRDDIQEFVQRLGRSQAAASDDVTSATKAPTPDEDGPRAMRTDGVARIEAERRRQFKRWTFAHDDSHWDGSLAAAAACLAVEQTDGEFTWPYYDGSWIQNLRDAHAADNRVRQLEIAGALIAAEIDRLLRAAAREGQPTGEQE